MPYIVTFAGCERRKDISGFVSASYILYLIRLESRENGQQYFSRKRFKELQALHRHVVQSGAVGRGGPPFPDSNVSATEFVLGSTVDPKGSFVLARKAALETFFQQLIDNNPQMFSDVKVQRFFELIPSDAAGGGGGGGGGGGVASGAGTGASAGGGASLPPPPPPPPQYNLRDKYSNLYNDNEDGNDMAVRYYIDSSARMDELEQWQSGGIVKGADEKNGNNDPQLAASQELWEF